MVSISNGESGLSVRTKLNTLFDSKRNQINVFDFLSASEQTSVINRTGTDVTSSVSSAIAAIPSTGSTLYFPAGRYVTTGGFTLSKPFKLVGDGGGSLSASTATTQIENTSSSSKLFTATADWGYFSDLGLLCSAVTPVSGSSLIYTNGAVNYQKIDYDHVWCNGSYDQIDVGVGNSWFARNCALLNATHWGFRVRNTVLSDAGDALIQGCWIYPACSAGALAGIKWESSGGLKLFSNKIISNDGTRLPNGVHADFTGTSGEWQFIGNDVDTGDICFKLTVVPSRGMIAGNVLITHGSNEAIQIAQGSQIIIGENTLIGNDTTKSPITFGNVQNLTVAPQMAPGFSTSTLSYLGTGTPSSILDFSQIATTNSFDPSNSRGGLTLSNGNLTVSSTTVNASGAIARTLRYGFQQSTYNEFKFTAIGSAGGSGVGIINANQDPHLGHYLGDTGNNSLGYYGDGSVFLNNALLTSLSAYTTNDVISMHVNPTLKRIWFRKNAGNWNNNASANPDTGTLGIDISALGSPVYPAIDVESATGVCVANFGATAYAQTPTVTAGNW